jgi:hypothetical protein
MFDRNVAKRDHPDNSLLRFVKWEKSDLKQRECLAADWSESTFCTIFLLVHVDSGQLC